MPRRPAAFSLVELMVVVAIIAALIAILLPSMSAAREKARIAYCGSQLKQHGAAYVMYAQSNQDRFLWYNTGSSMVGNGRAGSWAGYGAPSWTPGKRPLNVYLGVSRTVADDSDVFVSRCPSDIGHGPTFAVTDTVYLDVGSSYPYNRFSVFPSVETLHKYTFAKIRRPSYLLMSGDHNIHNYLGGGNRFEYWHDTKRITANILYVDTHVAYHPVTPGNANDNYTFIPE